MSIKRDGLIIYLETTQQLIETDNLRNVLIFDLIFFIHIAIDITIRQLDEMFRLKSLISNLFEKLDLDDTVALMKFKKRFIIFII